MSKDVNPYAVNFPVSGAASPESRFRLNGKILILEKGSDLPHRCVKCNAPAAPNLRSTQLRWHHPAWFLTLLLNPLIYMVVYLIVNQSARVTIGLCPEHRRSRNLALAAALVSLFIGFCLMLTGTSTNSDTFSKIGMGVTALAPLLAAWKGTTGIRTVRISKAEIQLKGFSQVFLDQPQGRDWLAAPRLGR